MNQCRFFCTLADLHRFYPAIINLGRFHNTIICIASVIQVISVNFVKNYVKLCRFMTKIIHLNCVGSPVKQPTGFGGLTPQRNLHNQ